MAFDPLSFLILKFRGRSVAVLRDHCSDYDSVVAAAWNNLRSLKHFPNAGLVLLASIPGYPDTSEVELSKEVWPSLSKVVHSVTIALESGASPMASGLSPASDPAAAAIDQPILSLLFPSEMQGAAAAESARSAARPVPRVRLPPGNNVPPVANDSDAKPQRLNFDGLFPAEQLRFNFRPIPVTKDGPPADVKSEECKQQ